MDILSQNWLQALTCCVISQECVRLNDIIMRLGFGWPMSYLDVEFRKWVANHGSI